MAPRLSRLLAAAALVLLLVAQRFQSGGEVPVAALVASTLPPHTSSSPAPPPSATLTKRIGKRIALSGEQAGAASTLTYASKGVTIALNRHVFRFSTEREYTCPQLGGARCLVTTERSKFSSADAIIDVLKDPRKAQSLDFKARCCVQLPGHPRPRLIAGRREPCARRPEPTS